MSASRANTRRLGLALVLAASVCACGTDDPNVTPEMLADGAYLQQVVSQIQTAPYTTPHSGVRLIENDYFLNGTLHHLAYREEIWTDGQGGYAIDPLGALTPVMEGFDELQKDREGFFWLYRDFLVRDLNLFLENYMVLLPGLAEEVVVAGRNCVQFHMARVADPQGRGYTVAMDLITGLVLKYEERDEGGTILSSMVYETFDPTPDFTGVEFHQPSNQKTPVDPDSNSLARDLGFDPLVPTVIPAGYQLSEAARLVGPQKHDWLMLAWQDGVETLFFLMRGDVGITPGSQTQSFDFVVGNGASGVSAGSTPNPVDSVLSHRIGALSVVHGNIGTSLVIVMGKVPESDLLDMLESALD